MRALAWMAALLAGLGGASAAQACSCDEKSLEDHVKAAERIVIARIVSATHQPDEEHFSEVKVTCSHPLLVGNEFVLFLDADAVITICGGSFLYFRENVPGNEELQKIRALVAEPKK